MKKQNFRKFITDWVWYEQKLQQFEQVGLNLTPEHPMWKMSDRYAELISEKFSISLTELKKELEPIFMNQSKIDIDTFVDKLILNFKL